MDEKRITEDDQYEKAKAWLKLQGELKITYFDSENGLRIKATFTKNNKVIEVDDLDDIVKLITSLYESLRGD